MNRSLMEFKTFVNQLIKPLSHEKRFKTFLTLSERARNASELKKALKAEETTIHGWLRDLRSAGLVKHEKGVYKLTGKGRAWVSYLEGADMITRYGDFFNSIQLERIPDKFRSRIMKVLGLCEPHFEPEPMLIANEMCRRAEKKTWVASDIALEWSGNIILDKLRSIEGFEFLGVSKFERSPVKRYELIERGAKLRKEAENAIYMGVLLVDEVEAGMLLPADEKSLSWKLGFYSKDFEVIALAKQIFLDIWEKCIPFTLPKS